MEININISVTATTEAEDTITTTGTTSVLEGTTTTVTVAADNKIITTITIIIVQQMIRMRLVVCKAIIIFGVIVQIIALKLPEIIITTIITVVTIITAVTIWEIVLTINGKAILCKALIIINLTMVIIHSLSNNIHQTMYFLTTITINNSNYHRHQTIQVSIYKPYYYPVNIVHFK